MTRSPILKVPVHTGENNACSPEKIMPRLLIGFFIIHFFSIFPSNIQKMEVKNLFDPAVKQEIITRINNLTPRSQPVWGNMNVAQMLAHCQKPLGVAVGSHKLSGGFFMKLIGPLFKKTLFNEKPFKHSLPTDKSFIIAETRDFDKEKSQLIKMILDFSEPSMSGEPHPFFGKLTKEQWSMGTWKHLNHHLQQFGV